MKALKILGTASVIASTLTLAAEEAATPLLTALSNTTITGYESSSETTPHALQFTRPVFLRNLPREGTNGPYQAPWIVTPFAAHDFNRDGRQDLALGISEDSGYVGSFIQIHLGRGNGTFLPGTFYNVPAHHARTADMDGDGNMDIVSCGPAVHINILFGKTNGTFTATVFDGGGITASALDVGDFNNDGLPDIVVNRHPWRWSDDRAVLLYINEGNRTFSSRYFPIDVFGDYTMLKGDFNGDGYLDVLTGGSPGYVFWAGDGNAGLTTNRVLTPNAFTGFYGTGVSDLNSDQRSDLLYLASTNSSAAFVSTLLASGNLAFNYTLQSPLPAIPSAYRFAELNNDGILDLAIGHQGQRQASVLRGTANGAFVSGTQLSNLQFNVQFILPGDFNGDGRTDLVLGGRRLHGTYPRVPAIATVMSGVGELSADDLPWQHNDGSVSAWIIDGTNLLSAFRLQSTTPSNSDYRLVGFNDFNNDQQADVLLENRYYGAAVGFVHGRNITNIQFLAPMPVVVGLADLDGDGKKEILNRWQNKLFAAFMQGTTRSRQQPILLTATNIITARLVGTGDFNRDGKTDLLWETTAGSFRIDFLNNTVYLSSTSFNLREAGWRPVHVEDLNHDGYADIFVHHTDRRLSVWLMNGAQRVGILPLHGGRPTAFGWSIAGNR